MREGKWREGEWAVWAKGRGEESKDKAFYYVFMTTNNIFSENDDVFIENDYVFNKNVDILAKIMVILPSFLAKTSTTTDVR